MTFLDYVVLTVVIISTAFGATKGILKGSIAVLSAVFGLIIAACFYEYAAGFIGFFVSTTRVAEFLGYIAIFLAVIIGGAFLSYRLRRGIKGTVLSRADHLMGASFGLLRGWLICSVLYLGLTAFPARLDAVERAWLGPVLLEGSRVIVYLASPQVRERFFEGYEKVQAVWEKQDP